MQNCEMPTATGKSLEVAKQPSTRGLKSSLKVIFAFRFAIRHRHAVYTTTHTSELPAVANFYFCNIPLTSCG